MFLSPRSVFFIRCHMKYGERVSLQKELSAFEQQIKDFKTPVFMESEAVGGD